MLLSAIETFKQQYYSQISEKLIISSTTAHQSFLKTFLNNEKEYAFLLYFITINSFQSLGIKLNYLITLLLKNVH